MGRKKKQNRKRGDVGNKVVDRSRKGKDVDGRWF